MKKVHKIIMIIVIILLVLLAALTWWLPSASMTGNRQTIDEAIKWQKDHYDLSFYDDLEKTDYTVSSYDDYVLHVQFLKNPKPSTKYVIISHGYTDNHIGALKYAPTYLDLGYNIVVYDLRGHGENERTFTTYGIREGQDLDYLIKDTRERYTDISELGIHGESLGAATTVTCLKYKPDVDFAVADCGFSDIENVLKNLYKSHHVPTVIVDLADIGSRLRYHYAIKDMRPIDSLDDNTIPVLFIHGADDTFILPKNSEDMYKRTKSRTEFHTIPGATHANSVLTEPEMYKEIVKGFLAN